MFGDIYPMTYMGKQLICWEYETLAATKPIILSQTYAANRESKIEL